MNEKYQSIINLEHHTSPNRPRMSIAHRATQFSSFNALTGYKEKIAASTTTPTSQIELTPELEENLNEELTKIQSKIAEEPFVTLTYFVPEEFDRGTYHTITSRISKIDTFHKCLYLSDKAPIKLSYIINISLNIE